MRLWAGVGGEEKIPWELASRMTPSGELKGEESGSWEIIRAVETLNEMGLIAGARERFLSSPGMPNLAVAADGAGARWRSSWKGLCS
jgi:hypothetical protein